MNACMHACIHTYIHTSLHTWKWLQRAILRISNSCKAPYSRELFTCKKRHTQLAKNVIHMHIYIHTHKHPKDGQNDHMHAKKKPDAWTRTNRFGNKVSVGGDHITAELRGAKNVPVEILDHQNGHYTCTYTAIWAGEYRQDTFVIVVIYVCVCNMFT